MGDSDIKKEVEKQKEPQKTEKTAKEKSRFLSFFEGRIQKNYLAG